jgi:pyruvate/2-oxoglutarate dehydrogenase complex dihydrolipoamide dehydrogenase (E3) component
MTEFDVVVLGGGSAGSTAAGAAQEAGAETLMINDGELGGLCILRGCMPTKSMLQAAHAIHEARHLDPFGARLEGHIEVDFSRIAARKDGHVARFKKAKVDSIESADYTVIDARGRFVEPGVIEAGGQRFRGKKFVIATGSVPVSLPIPGIDDVPVWNSDDVMRLTAAPKRLIVQGGGPIGLELAQFFARIGTEVTLVNRSPLLGKTDAESGVELRQVLLEEPRLNLAIPGTIERLTRDGDGLRASLVSNGATTEIEADALLMAVGRESAVGEIGLETVGLSLRNGVLQHDSTMRTEHPDIYVAGDSTGDYQILHLANQEGQVAGHNAAGGPSRSMDYRLGICVVFTDPPFAQIGLGEQQALDAGLDVVVGRVRFAETGRAITMEVGHGLWKLIVDRQSGEILGSSILGPRADDLIHEIAILMHFRAKVGDIFDLPWYHPTVSEVFLNLARNIEDQRT